MIFKGSSGTTRRSWWQVAAGALLGLFWWRFLMPIGAAIEARQDRLSDLDAEISQAVQRRMQLAEIRSESEALQVQLARLKSILPLERETDEILREVGNIAETASMRVVRILPRPIVDRDVYSEMAWDFQVQSTYHNLGEFSRCDSSTGPHCQHHGNRPEGRRTRIRRPRSGRHLPRRRSSIAMKNRRSRRTKPIGQTK